MDAVLAHVLLYSLEYRAYGLFIECVIAIFPFGAYGDETAVLEPLEVVRECCLLHIKLICEFGDVLLPVPERVEDFEP